MTKATLETIMFEERDALLTESTCVAAPTGGDIGVLPYAAVADLETVEKTPTFLRHRHPVAFEALAGAKGDAKVQVCDSLGLRALWSHVSDKSYRSDYITFLREYRG